MLRLYSVDHVDLFVSNARDPLTASALGGLEHSLLLANARGERFVLSPVVVPLRPRVLSQPFSTALVLDREGTYGGAHGAVPTARFFLYPVHVSRA